MIIKLPGDAARSAARLALQKRDCKGPTGSLDINDLGFAERRYDTRDGGINKTRAVKIYEHIRGVDVYYAEDSYGDAYQARKQSELPRRRPEQHRFKASSHVYDTGEREDRDQI